MERAAQTFPKLTPAQIDRIAAVGRRCSTPAGEVLFEVGDQNARFFVVLSGGIEIVQPVGSVENPIVVHGPGQFSGDIGMLSARRSIVRGRTTVASDLLIVDNNALRTLVQRDAELSEIFMRAFILRRVQLMDVAAQDLVLIGSRNSADTLRIKEFLTRNAQPFRYQDVETEPGIEAMLEKFQVGVNEIPIVICQGGHILKNPSTDLLAQMTGLEPKLDATVVRDVVVVGAGPAGLAAAVYGASEGLDVLVLEGTAPGGQAGTSSRIENYLGFPTGISGQALSGRALMQAEKFGAEVAIGRTAVRLDCTSRPYRLYLSDGQEVRARSIVIASGVKYRKLDLPSLARFEGAGIYYSATRLEGQLCVGQDIAIVGGGNSAGQAAVYLSQVANHVQVLVRGPGLAESMSRYLIQRIESTPNIDLCTRCQITELEGTDRLERVTWRHVETGTPTTKPLGNLFLMTGADPNTKWLAGCLLLDDKEFVKTGADLTPEDLLAARWPLPRRPYLMETTIPGVFCVGDARSGSVKRVASAVGEGSISVQLLHRALQEI
ncbi:MAG TPA: FAD-dependent oxidoreductase [Polyangia bacterium]|nr:FAD-dependent oxidoreductase [Polyangia bacterium]